MPTLNSELTVDTRRLLWSGAAAGVVVAGVVFKNTTLQYDAKEERLATLGGGGLFVLGWLLVAYALSRDKTGLTEKLTIWAPSVLIAVSAMVASRAMQQDRDAPMWAGVVFALAWLVLGWYAGSGAPGTRFDAVAGSVLVIGSMMFLLPWQRKHDIVDGPGMPLFALGWTVVVLAHSITSVG